MVINIKYCQPNERLEKAFEDYASGHHLQVTACERMERSRILGAGNRIICDNLWGERKISGEC